MKTLALLTSAIFLLPVASGADSPKVQLSKAGKQAAAGKKDILLVFSGSTWNQASKDFESKILKAPKFVEAIGKNFVQVIIEIPTSRDKAHSDLIEFEKSYGFRGIPTVILADSKGRPYATTPPVKDKPEDFVATLAKLRQIRVDRDKSFQDAQKANGKKKAELIVKALKTLPQNSIAAFYEAEIAMVEKADPKNETVYAGEIRKAEALKKEQARYNDLFAKRKFDEIIKTSRAEGAKMKGEDAQRMKLYEVKALYAEQKYEEALKAVEALKKIAPESELGKRSTQFSSQVRGAMDREKRMKEAAAKRSKPVVSKPVAIVTDIKQLQKDAKKAEDDLAKAVENEKKLMTAKGELDKKISAAEAALAALRKEEKASAEVMKKAVQDREKLARKSKAMKEVVENHLAMEKRKREISELEKRAAELQKQADDLRKKASDIRKGK